MRIKDTVTGLYSGPGVIGHRWTKVGRMWTTTSALGGSIAVWKERKTQRWCSPKAKDSSTWVIVGHTDRGPLEYRFDDWVLARSHNRYPDPLPSIATLRFTADEVDLVEESLRDSIGDADESGELIMRVVEALKHYEENTL